MIERQAILAVCEHYAACVDVRGVDALRRFLETYNGSPDAGRVIRTRRAGQLTGLAERLAGALSGSRSYRGTCDWFPSHGRWYFKWKERSR